MTRAYARSFVFVAIMIVAMVPTLTFAAMPDQIVSCDGIGCKICDIATTAQNVLNTGIYIAVFLSAGLFAYAGIIYLTNAANHGEVTRARTIFANVLIGLVIILAAWLVIDTIMRVLVNDNATLGPWNEICTSRTAA